VAVLVSVPVLTESFSNGTLGIGESKIQVPKSLPTDPGIFSWLTIDN
jgi:hypothetical protein